MNKLLIILNNEDLTKMNRGQVARWAAGAAMWLVSFDDTVTNKYGDIFIETMGCSDEAVETNKEWREWLENDYRTVVLQTDRPLLEIFDFLKGHNVYCNLQRSAHEKILMKKGLYAENDQYQFKPMAVACFISDENAKRIGLDKLELLK